MLMSLLEQCRVTQPQQSRHPNQPIHPPAHPPASTSFVNDCIVSGGRPPLRASSSCGSCSTQQAQKCSAHGQQKHTDSSARAQ